MSLFSYLLFFYLLPPRELLGKGCPQPHPSFPNDKILALSRPSPLPFIFSILFSPWILASFHSVLRTTVSVTFSKCKSDHATLVSSNQEVSVALWWDRNLCPAWPSGPHSTSSLSPSHMPSCLRALLSPMGLCSHRVLFLDCTFSTTQSSMGNFLFFSSFFII